MSAYYASFLLGLLVYFLPSNVCVVAIAELYGAEEAELHLNEDPEPGSFSELRDSILDIGASVSVCLLSESRKLDLCLDIHRARAQAENVDVVVTQPNYTEKLGRSYVKCRMRVVRTRDGDGPVKNTFYCPKARVMTTIPVDLPAVYVSSSDIDNSVLLCDSNMRLIHFIRNLNFIIESKTEIEKKND